MMAFQWRIGILRSSSWGYTSRFARIYTFAERKQNLFASPAKQEKHSQINVAVSNSERELFGLFKRVLEEERLETTVRVAGGWVRDKLLGHESKMDVDIALDNMTGAQFAMKINEWCQRKGKKQFAIGIIGKNPDKSKHLETATVRIDNFSIDFVNLRTETYSCDSRIPQVQIGTPTEDAFRRDLTINSLFYNVNTDTVEDFTGLGLQDLRDRVIRTPLEANVTFLDDPLRVLRSIRFASRFGFTIAPDLLEATQHPEVLNALRHKVSRERVAQELKQMLNHTPHTHALVSICLLYSLNLLPTVFSFPPADTIVINKSSQIHAIKKTVGGVSQSAYQFTALGSADLAEASSFLSTVYAESVSLLCALQYAIYTHTHPHTHAPRSDCVRSLLEEIRQAENHEEVYIHRLALLLLPVANVQTPMQCRTKTKLKPLSEHVVQNSLRWPARVSSQTQVLQETTMKLLAIMDTYPKAVLCSLNDLEVRSPDIPDWSEVSLESLDSHSVRVGDLTRLQLARLFRQSDGLITQSLMCALAWVLLNSRACQVHCEEIQASKCAMSHMLLREAVQVDAAKVEEELAAFGGIFHAIQAMKVKDTTTIHPMINGAGLKNFLPTLDGPSFRVVLEAQLELQFARPDCTEQDVQRFLVHNFPQYT